MQLVLVVVKGALRAPFLLGMFWTRTTGHGAFAGLLAGTAAAALHHGLTLPAGAVPGVKGGWLAVTHTYYSEMAQNFWTAIDAWTVCFLVTILVSLLTRPRPDAELTGLVYSLTPRQDDGERRWYMLPAALRVIFLAGAALLHPIFHPPSHVSPHPP